MPDVRDVFYHGVRQQVRRVLEAMGKERIEKGLTAFDDGQSNWSHCFFARALKGECDLNRVAYPEQAIMHHLGISTPIPIRIVYTLFDGIGKKGLTMTKADLHEFVQCFLDQDAFYSCEELPHRLEMHAEMNKKIDELLRTIDFSKAGV